jgi:thioredoxin 1
MSDFNELINSDKPTLVDFWAPWCSPCRMMIPIIDQTKTELGDKANVLKVDVDKNKELSIKYGVRGVPTFIIFKNGEVVWRRSGIIPKKLIEDKISEFV